MTADIVDVTDLDGSERTTVDLLIEIDRGNRRACAAQAVFRHYHVTTPE